MDTTSITIPKRLRGVADYPDLVCPEKDSPLSWWHWLGWNGMSRRIWDQAGVQNPIIWYLHGRRRSALVLDLLGMAPYLMLLAADVFFAVLATRYNHPGALFLWLSGSLLFLPALVGAWTQLMIYRNFQRTRRYVPFDELAVTELKASEYIGGFSLRPVMVQSFALVTMGIVTIPLMFYDLFYNIYLGNWLLPLEYPLSIFLMIYRIMYLKTCTELAAVYAIRACLFMPRGVEVIMRMFRDWFWPWALIPSLIVAFMTALIYINNRGEFPLFILIIIALSIFLLWGMWHLPGTMREVSADAIFWLARSRERWYLRTGHKSKKIPKSLWHSWHLEETIKKDPV